MKKSIVCALVVLGLASQTASAGFKDFVKKYFLFGDKKKSAMIWGTVAATTGLAGYFGYKAVKNSNISGKSKVKISYKQDKNKSDDSSDNQD